MVAFLHELIQYHIYLCISILISLLRKICIAVITCWWLLFFMNGLNMSIKIFLLKNIFISVITFKWLLFFMNWFTISNEMSFVRKNLPHKCYIWTVSFLHELIQYGFSERFTFWEKSALQSLHLNGLFFSLGQNLIILA